MRGIDSHCSFVTKFVNTDKQEILKILRSPRRQLETSRKRAVTQKNRDISALQPGTKQQTKGRNHERNVFGTSWWVRPLRFDASDRIVTPRETFYFTALTLRIANRLCAQLLQTRRNRRGGLVKMLSFVRARTNLHDPSTMLTLIELRLYRIAINFSTLLLLLPLLRMILVEPCCGSPQIAFATAASLCSSELSPAFFSFNRQLSVRLIRKKAPSVLLE